MPALNDANYVIDAKGCWIYGKGKTERRVITRKKISMTAPRFFYLKYKGKIPKNYEIDHLCFNGRCVNPEHLEAVTHTVNIRRRRSSKITNNHADSIRDLYKRGMKQIAIALLFNVGQPHISRIVRERRWA